MTQTSRSRSLGRLALAGMIGGLALAGIVGAGALARAVTAAKEPPMGPMSRDAAVKMIKGFLAAYKVPDGPGLNDKNLGGADIEGRRVFFEYQPEKNTLRSLATVYCFRKPPKPGVIDGFKKEAAGGTDTGGGSVEYVGDSKCLFLGRSYAQSVDGAQFTKDTQRLLAAAKVWSEQVVERVATKVFHPEDLK